MNDLIDRQAAINAIENTECELSTEEWDEITDAIMSVPSAQPTNIQDILEYLNTILHPIVSPEHWNVYSELYDMISALPSAEPKRKNGKWIITSEFEDCYYAKCNQCNITQVFYFNKPLTKYCPDCGAKMDGGGDDGKG